MLTKDVIYIFLIRSDRKQKKGRNENEKFNEKKKIGKSLFLIAFRVGIAKHNRWKRVEEKTTTRRKKAPNIKRTVFQ